MSTTVSSPIAEQPVRAQVPVPARRRRNRGRRGPLAWLIVAVLVLLAAVWLFPFWIAVVNGFKSAEDYLNGSPLSLPHRLDFTTVENFWVSVDFTRKLINSIIISGATAIIGVVLSLLAAFALGIGKVRGRIWLLAVLMIAFTIPQEALVYPLFLMTRDLNLYDSLWGIIIIESVLQAAFGTYMLLSVLGTFPTEILEAAELDGASRRQLLIHVVFPLTRPTSGVLMVFFFIWTWNDFFLPMILLPSADNQTVSVALGALSGQYISDPTSLAGASLTGILPALVFFLIFQRTLMRGVNIGAIK